MSYLKLLTTLSGEEITENEEWKNYRRREILNLFRENVYGRCPVDKPNDLSFKTLKTVKRFHGKKLTYQEIEISFSNYSFAVKSFLPECEGKMPAFVYIMHEYEEERSDLINEPNCEYVPIFDITSNGYAVFVMPTSGIYPDWEHKSDYKDGVFKIFSPNREERKSDDWATISAWAWGASRVMDYIETDDRIDKSAVAVAGHSRGGKTALWCAAQDERFCLAISNSSGCMGAAMLKGKTGEHIKDINITDWFCDNFKSYNDREELLPVDQHMLLSLIAPRFVYVGSSSEDDWSDPKNERLSCRLASEVFEKIYGKTGVVLPDEPVENDTAYHEGNIGYHSKTGKHGIIPYDWDMFMKFRKKHGI